MPVKTVEDRVIVHAPLDAADRTRLSKLGKSTAITVVEAKDLDFIEGWSELRKIQLYACKVEIDKLLPHTCLESVFINTIRSKTPDLSALGSLSKLRSLGFGYVPHLTAVPDLSACEELRRLSIFNCKRLNDLASILRIPALEIFSIVDTPQKPEDLIDIMAMPSLTTISGAFGSKKLDEEFRRLINLHGLTYG